MCRARPKSALERRSTSLPPAAGALTEGDESAASLATMTAESLAPPVPALTPTADQLRPTAPTPLAGAMAQQTSPVHGASRPSSSGKGGRQGSAGASGRGKQSPGSSRRGSAKSPVGSGTGSGSGSRRQTPPGSGKKTPPGSGKKTPPRVDSVSVHVSRSTRLELQLPLVSMCHMQIISYFSFRQRKVLEADEYRWHVCERMNNFNYSVC